MFDDPQVVLGMAIGIVIVVVGAALGVLGHRKQEQAAARESGERR